MLDTQIRTFIESTNGIFYYKNSENIKIKIDNFKITNNNAIVIRDENNNYRIIYNFIDLPKNINFNIIFKFRKSFKNNNYELINPIRRVSEINKNENFINNLNEAMWFPVKSNTSDEWEEKENYKLIVHDIIKLGRIKFEVINIHTNKENETNKNNKGSNYSISNLNSKAKPIFNINIQPDQYKISNINKNKDKEKNEDDEKKENAKKTNKEEKESEYHETINYNSKKSTNCSGTLTEKKNNRNNNIITNDFEAEICYICLNQESTKENPIVRICKCKNFVHYECLKRSLNIDKLIIQENQKRTVTTYYFPKFNCGVCLCPYPIRFRIPEYNKVYNLIDLKMPEEFNYLVLESLDYIKEKKNIKKVHVVILTDEVIKIGRSNTNDIIYNDISVSRSHCELKFNKDTGDLILENKSEKFGTLVLIRNNIKMNENEIKFQVGKSLISAKLCTKDVTEQTTEYNFG
jgi:hypothetical protein